MSRRSREILNRIICHHMVQGINKEEIFKNNKYKDKYLSLLQKYYKKYKVEIISYCIMDNHTHLILYSTEIQNISNFMRQINTEYAIYYNKINNRIGYVFRDRFKSIPILSKEQLYVCIKYIHMNPVKAGIVQKEEDYKYSSYNDFLNKSGFLNQNILNLLQYESNNYIDKFKSIPYKDIYNDKIKIEIILKGFLKKENINLEQIRKDKKLISKFLYYLISKGYNYSKGELAKILYISKSTLYREIKKVKNTNGKN